MSKTIYLILGLLACTYCNAQKDSISKENINSVFIPETHPASFPGGMDSLKRFLIPRYKTPDSLLAEGVKKIQGTITVSFTIGKNGTPTNFQIIKSLHPALDNEFLRILRLMPRWEPEMLKGMPQETNIKQSITIDIGG